MADSAFANALTQLEIAASVLQLDPAIYSLLQQPQRVIRVAIPVMMDTGVTRIFTGFRSQYNNACGPYKGGIRFHPNVSEDEVMALSFWMTMKTSAIGLPLGGGKGGVIVDPKKLSLGELERLSRGYVRALYKYLGPDQDVAAPDVYTNAQIMAWMVDEYEKLVGHAAPGMITGKPIDKGGSQGRGTATAQGGLYVLEEVLKQVHQNPASTTVAIQGFGNAGAHLAELASALGCSVQAVSDSSGAIITTCGSIDVPALVAHKAKTGSVANFPGTEPIMSEALLELPVDVLVPAALENQITQHNAPRLKAKIILELANGPTTPEADEILHAKKILVVPDILANAGGVAVSYFEQLQNASNTYWSEAEVLAKLKPIMQQAFAAIWDTKEKYAIDMRTAAFVAALERIATAVRAARG